MVETRNVEYKETVVSEDWLRWVKTFCGFANTEGGTIYIGYKDDGKFCGLTRNQIDDVQETIKNEIKKHTRPNVKYDISYYEENGLYGMIVNVPRRDTAMTWLIDPKKETAQIYIRHDGSTEYATEEEMIELLSRVKDHEYDMTNVGHPMSNLSFDELNEKYLSFSRGSNLTEKDLISLGILTPEKDLTLTGYIFADKTDYENSKVVCNTWPGTTKGSKDCEDSKVYYGSFTYLMDKILDYIYGVDYYKFGLIKNGISNSSQGSFDSLVLREIIINALAHRDYRIYGSEVQVNCFRDRIEISNPGNSLNYVDEIVRMKLEASPSIRRNKAICNVLLKCGLMEEKGSGFDLVIDNYKDLSEEYAPIMSSDRRMFTIIVKNKKYIYESSTFIKNDTKFVASGIIFMTREDIYLKNPKIQEIENVIKNSPYITLDDLSEEVGLSKSGVKYNISMMKSAGLIKRSGGLRGTYELINEIDRPCGFFELSNEVQNKVVKWCKQFFIQKEGFNEKHTSYGLKHILQNYDQTYLTNGQFKAAMIFAGFRFKDSSEQNWHFDIAENSPALNLNLE